MYFNTWEVWSLLYLCSSVHFVNTVPVMLWEMHVGSYSCLLYSHKINHSISCKKAKWPVSVNSPLKTNHPETNLLWTLWVYVIGSIPWFFVLKLAINFAQALEGEFVCLSFWGICGTVYKWVISPLLLLKARRLQGELELTARLINFKVLLSWMRWLFVGIGFELTDKPDKNWG